MLGKAGVCVAKGGMHGEGGMMRGVHACWKDTSKRYAPYWNAFLFDIKINWMKCRVAIETQASRSICDIFTLRMLILFLLILPMCLTSEHLLLSDPFKRICFLEMRQPPSPIMIFSFAHKNHPLQFLAAPLAIRFSQIEFYRIYRIGRKLFVVVLKMKMPKIVLYKFYRFCRILIIVIFENQN